MKRIVALLIIFILLISLGSPASATGIDKMPPTIKAINPSDKSENIPINQTININFNENIYENKTFSKIAFISSDGVKISYKATISKKILKIKSNNNLDNNMSYSIKIPAGAIADKSGNTIKKAVVFSFKTMNSAVTSPTPTTTPAKELFPDDLHVEFPDSIFEAAVRKAANKSEGKLFYKDVKAITSIDNMEGASSIEGIQYLTGLSTVTISSKVLDLSPLVKGTLPNLKALTYGYNPAITDISALASLKTLTYLSILYTSVEDLNALKELDNLEILYLCYNMISDVSPLSDLKKLKSLEISNNRLQDISPLSELNNLEKLDVSSNSIINISSIVNLKMLKDVNLYWNDLTDVSALKNLEGLNCLRISYNNIKNLSVLSGVYDKLTTKDFDINKPEMVKYSSIQSDYLKKAINRVDSIHAIFISDSEVPKDRLQVYADEFENTIYKTLADMIPEINYSSEKIVFLFVNCRGTKNPSVDTIKYWGSLLNFNDATTYQGEKDPYFSSFQGYCNKEGFALIKDNNDYNFNILAHEYIHFMNNTLFYHKNSFELTPEGYPNIGCTGISRFIDEGMASCIAYQIVNDKKTWQEGYIVNAIDSLVYYPDMLTVWDGNMSNCQSSGISFAYLYLTQGMEKIIEYIKLTATQRNMENNFISVFGITSQGFAKQLNDEIEIYRQNPSLLNDLKAKLASGQQLPGWMGNY